MSNQIDDLKSYMESYSKQNPFLYKYVWAGAISKKHQNHIKTDNDWYQQVMGLVPKKEEKLYEPAPF